MPQEMDATHLFMCTHTHSMATKTLSIANDVFERLKRLKLEGESFSDTIRRLTERGTISEFGGLWKEIPDEDFQGFCRAIEDIRTKANQGLAGVGKDDMR